MNWETVEPAIEKACTDPFEYVLGLTTGEVFAFVLAHPREVNGEVWLQLEGFGEWNEDGVRYFAPGTYAWGKKPTAVLARGASVRYGQIAWVADCPGGS